MFLKYETKILKVGKQMNKQRFQIFFYNNSEQKVNGMVHNINHMYSIMIQS